MNIRIRQFLVLAAVAAGASLLAGCENPVIVSGVDVANTYSPDELRRYGSGGNALRVDVAGDPFGDGAEATADAVVAAMQGRNIGPTVAFARAPTQEAQPPSRVVMFVNPRRLVGAETLCDPRGPITTQASTDSAVRLTGAWCQSNFVLSRASAHVEEADGLASERFQALVSQLTIALFPPKNPHDRSRLMPCPPFCR